MPVHELNGDRTFAHTGGHAFDGTMPNVAHGKYARDAGFQKKWIAVEGPARGPLAGSHHVGTGEDESMLIALDETIEPVRARLGADENEQGADRDSLDRSGVRTGNGDGFQLGLAVHGD